MRPIRRLLFILLSILGLTSGSNVTLGQSPFPANVRRVLFLGNSITYAGKYVTAIETYYVTRYPAQSIEFINAGLPSETVSGLSEDGHADGKFPRPDLHERMARVLAETKPDLVFACYGMNDGIYLPFDEGRFAKFRAGIQWLHEEVLKSGARIMHITPPDYDELKGGNVGYATVLDRYADWLLAQKTAQNWQVLDIHYPMKQFLEAHRNVDATFGIAGFALAEDGVHPDDAGHWLIARSILLGLGEKAVAQVPDLKSLVTSVPNGPQLLKLIAERQNLTKDAWLTATGHKRPGMNVGLSLPDAKAKAVEIEKQIRTLVK